ncbi:MAG: AAA family ATPase [Planctomycetota bacterium]
MAKTIVITGKGGVGKTVIAALMIRHLREHAAGPVLAIDADPDANLGTVLGVEVHDTLGDVREQTLAEIRKLPPGMDKAAYIEAGLHETIVETDGVDFLVMGRPEGPGCYCYVNNLLREFADKLLPSYQWMVMDSEAGMEHLSRRTASHVDHLIAVVDENPLSMDCARRIEAVIASVKNEVRHKHVLANGVPEDRLETVRAAMNRLDMEYLGCIPHDEAIREAIIAGRPLTELGDSPAVAKISELMDKLGV